ncbi:MAG TPA: hypothetical protein VG722_03670, partial [Tepidisphaeraceae bacterium]|nr:hypothetical protein [Tepidisphaeraceae bacterium]
MALSAYIETTITGHLTSRLPNDTEIAGQMLATRRWWKDERQRFELFTSLLVQQEASQGDPAAAAERLNVIAQL